MEYTQIRNKRGLGLIMAMAGACWGALAGLIYFFNPGSYDFWFPGRIITYVLLLVAPALTFVPIGRVLGMRYYSYWAVASWALFGFIPEFVGIDRRQNVNQYAAPLALFLVALFGVVMSVALPIAYRVGFKLFTKRVKKYDTGRAWREAVLAALYVVLAVGLRAFGLLSLTYAIVLLLIVVVVELLFLSRSR